MDVALRFAYLGDAFDGFARQPGHRTVESALIDALRTQGLVEGSWRCGSRTDKGVSAAENVAKARLDRPHLEGVIPAVQAALPAGIWLTGAAPVDHHWNPRHAAWREYTLAVEKRGERLTDVRAAAACFVGSHDMSAFARVDGRDPKRDVRSFTVRSDGDLWRFRVRGRSFLWNQVRRMSAACLLVGAGKATVKDVASALRTGKGSFGLAPPEGLVLERVHYPRLRWTEAQHLEASTWSATRRAAAASVVLERVRSPRRG